jgi:hypothetical protein
VVDACFDEIPIALHYAWNLSNKVNAQERMERNCKERLKLSWEEFLSKYEQSSAAEKKMLYDKICPAVFHCLALLRHWHRNSGPSDDEAYVPDASDEDDDWAHNLEADEVSDLVVDEVREEWSLDVECDDALMRARLVRAITSGDDYPKAEEVSDLEVDEVREALKKQGLDVEGDDALVCARLVQAIEREEKERERERERPPPQACALRD